MQGESIKTKAIVVRSSQSGENNRVLTLLSPDLGRLTVIAKGVRSLRHKSMGSVQFLCYSEFVIKKIKDGLYSLVSAELIEGFFPISESVELLSYASYFASLCEMCVQPFSDSSEEVRLLLNTLHVMIKRKDHPELMKAVFEIKLCELCGIMPFFDVLCQCGEAAEFFNIADGEMCCSAHKSASCVSLAPNSISLAQYISSSTLKDALYADCENDLAFPLRRVLEPFIAYHLGNIPKSLEYLHKISKKI